MKVKDFQKKYWFNTGVIQLLMCAKSIFILNKIAVKIWLNSFIYLNIKSSHNIRSKKEIKSATKCFTNCFLISWKHKLQNFILFVF